jgi:D-alanyl-D-alanine carboxypeptidase
LRSIRYGIGAALIAMLAAVTVPAHAVAAPGDGYLPDGVRLSPFDLSTPAVNRLDPALLDAVQQAAQTAAIDGVTIGLTSGWRSPEFQRQLFTDAVAQYGSAEIAAQYVAAPEVSKHVTGKAVDIGPTDADIWLLANGQRFGLCQIYANEIWHFELAADYGGVCPPLRPNAAG